MISLVAPYLHWCRYLAAQEGVEPQLYADNLKCVSRDPGVLLGAAPGKNIIGLETPGLQTNPKSGI